MLWRLLFRRVRLISASLWKHPPGISSRMLNDRPSSARRIGRAPCGTATSSRFLPTAACVALVILAAFLPVLGNGWAELQDDRINFLRNEASAGSGSARSSGRSAPSSSAFTNRWLDSARASVRSVRPRRVGLPPRQRAPARAQRRFPHDADGPNPAPLPGPDVVDRETNIRTRRRSPPCSSRYTRSGSRPSLGPRASPISPARGSPCSRPWPTSAAMPRRDDLERSSCSRRDCCTASALLCKAAALPLPLVFLVLDSYPLNRFSSGIGTRSRTFARAVLEKLPLLLIGVLVMAAAFSAKFLGDPVTTSEGEGGALRLILRRLLGLLLC